MYRIVVLACDLWWYVCYILVSCFLGLDISPQDGSRWLPKRSVLFWTLVTWQKSLWTVLVILLITNSKVNLGQVTKLQKWCGCLAVLFLLTSVLGVGRWSTPHCSRCIPGKAWYSLRSKLGEPLGRPGWVRKIPSPTGIISPYRPVRGEPLYLLRYPGALC